MAQRTLPGVTGLLQVDIDEAIATLTLDRPKILNALNHEQRTNLETALRALDADAAVRVVVLAGSGRAFCAGQDQKESAAMDSDGAHRRILSYASLYRTMRRFSKPIIARLHGY